MKQRIIKRVVLLIVIILFISFAWSGIRKTFFPELEAERLIEKYYQAIIDEDYEKAYNFLYKYDLEYIDQVGSIDASTSLTEAEAKQFYQQKIAFLKQKDYRVKDYRIKEVEYEDGHSFWHHLELEVEIDGESYIMEETSYLLNRRLMVGEQDDSFAKYRDGRMKFMIGGEE